MEENIFAPTSRFADFNRRTLLGVVLTGIVTGVLSVVFAKVLNQFIISPALCRSATEAACTSSEVTAFHIAGVIAAVIAVVMLVNLSVYRPLLVAIAATISAWGIYGNTLPDLTWPWAMAVAVLFNIGVYLTFSWLLRIYNLIIALVIALILCGAVLFVSYL